jgi:hypothetical protein
MKQINILILFALCVLTYQINAQDTRYVDEIFSSVNVESNVTYGTNISVLTGMPAVQELKMDVYTPADDTETERPVVIYLHTGTFLPQYLNGQITGGKLDSTVVEICTRLAKRGYTAIAATYRQGWNPLTSDPNVRTETILKASYRGIQDVRTCIRNLRRTVAEESNPYGVDVDRIVLWGQGTGGYLSLGAATLDDYSEISSLDKFLNTETFLPYVTQELDGDIYGEVQSPLNLPNHVGYSSDFHLAVNMGGALGDTSWLDNVNADFNAPPIIGYHVLTDPFAPFSDGVVREPVNNEVVVRVSGTHSVVTKANAKGINDALTPALNYDDPLSQFINARVEALSPVTIDLSALGQGVTRIGETHMYPFIPPINPDTGGPRLEAGPWDWWSKPLLDAILNGSSFSSDDLHNDGLLTNPDMSPEKARAHIDTIMAHYIPRACQVLQLEECAIVVSTEELIDDSLYGLSVAPNPAVDRALVQTNPTHPMEAIQLFDMNGRYIRSHYGIDNHQYYIDRGDLPTGIYLVKVKFKEGISVRKLIFN